MKHTLFSCALGLLVGAAACSTQAQPDRFMGDWQGSVTVGGQAQPVAVYMIPLGDGRYEARFVADFAKRGPYLHRLRGTIRGDQFRFVDDLPYEAGLVAGTTADGIVFPASLWSARVEGDAAQGAIAGKQQGRFELRQTRRISPDLGKAPPPGAVVPFDGKNLDAWQARNANQPIRWKILPDGVLEVAGGGDLMTKETFGDHRLHLEFRLPYMPRSFGQGRGNSGVYLQGRYEVQVLDSYGLEGADNECGGIYQIARPAVNMCAPPLQWQSYDITFTAPKRDASGKKIANARATIRHNGVVIHDNLELPKTTGGALNEREGEPGPLLLQDHGNPVQFRDIWIERL